jgi:glycosyltransferase involved in cell wall biosynthesis
MVAHRDAGRDIIDVCIGTYLRPRGLRVVLEAIAAQRYAQVAAPDVAIVVIDNDAEGSGREVVAELVERTQLAVTYEVEPGRGISIVRNRAVAATRPTASFIAFLDDDEEPEADWLEQLIIVQRAYDADAVAGPVLPRHEQPLPAWMERGRFHERAQYATGARLPYVGTGNVLVRSAWLRRDAAPFDPRLALSGGEDTLFFLRLTRAGGSIVWSADAVVHETVPPSRAQLGWILRRAYRGGNSFARCEAYAWEGQQRVRRWTNRLARGLWRITRGLARVVIAPVRGGRAEALNGMRLAADGAGVVTSLFGFGYDEYVSTHGD